MTCWRVRRAERMAKQHAAYKRIAATSPEERAGPICRCDACDRDGQHAPMCIVHALDAEDRRGTCDCGGGS